MLAYLQLKFIHKKLVILSHFSTFLKLNINSKIELVRVVQAKSKVTELEVLGNFCVFGCLNSCAKRR